MQSIEGKEFCVRSPQGRHSQRRTIYGGKQIDFYSNKVGAEDFYQKGPYRNIPLSKKEGRVTSRYKTDGPNDNAGSQSNGKRTPLDGKKGDSRK